MRTRGFTNPATAIALTTILLFFTPLAPFAAQPECTGDRHYDGVACCPAPEAPATTTTSLPAPEPAACPDPPPCPSVVCECGEGTTVNYVTVNRCPEMPAPPSYVPCRRKKDGTYRCPRPAAPRRVLMPDGATK